MKLSRLEQWTLRASGSLSGLVYGSDRFEDGTPIVTSPVLYLSLYVGVAHTRNSTYALGEPYDSGTFQAAAEDTA